MLDISFTYSGHLLPEAKLGGGFPESVDLLWFSTQDLLVVDDEQRMRRDFFWKRRKWGDRHLN